MFSFPTHAHCLLALRFFEYHPKLLRITYIVRFRQDTGISSPSLYPSPPVALVLPAVDPIGNSAPARNSRAMWEGRRLNGRGADMLASLFDSCNARELLRGGELMKGRRQTRRRHGVVSARRGLWRRVAVAWPHHGQQLSTSRTYLQHTEMRLRNQSHTLYGSFTGNKAFANCTPLNFGEKRG
jgi:hypothetical protein